MIEHPEMNRPKLFTVRMSQDELDKLEALAKRRRINASDLVRRLIAEEEARSVSQITEEELFDRAVRAYVRRETEAQLKRGKQAAVTHPKSGGIDEDGALVLVDADRVVARYKYDAKDDRLIQLATRSPAKQRGAS